MNPIKRIKTAIEDFEMLKEGVWSPDDGSIECSINNLEESINEIQILCLNFSRYLFDNGYTMYSDKSGSIAYSKSKKTGKLTYKKPCELYKLFLKTLK